jgi:hypothetical protein
MSVLAGSKTSTEKEYSDLDILKDEKATAQHDPFFLVEGEFLSIKTKAGELVRFKLNAAQKRVLHIIKELRRAGKPVRIWALKARQEGISTLSEAIIYAFSSQKENLNSLIMADEGDKSDYLFEMSKLYHEQLQKNEPHLTPSLKKSNAKKLEFDEIHSQIIIESAENTEAARAFTYHIVHLSEVSRFRNLDAVMLGLNQSVPDHPDTMIIGETTANGMEAFYDEWMRAIEGKSDWFPLFVPWFWMEEYKLPLTDGKMHDIEGIEFNSDFSREAFLAEERQLKVANQLTDEQLNWRRYSIINKCKGKMLFFRQEYPSSWQEAFQVSGVNYFDHAGMERQKPVQPLATGEIFKIEMKYEFRKLEAGKIKIFEWPGQHEEYIITADASEAVGIDEGSVFVLNKRLNCTAAEVSGQYTPEDLAHLSIMLGYYYNTALIAPENKGYGYMVCQLVAKQYGNIYYKKNKLGQDTKEYGFNTNTVTRPQYLAQMNEEIRTGSTQLKSAKLINQCMTFVIDPKTLKAEAALNKQDGLVICRAIAGQVRVEFPYKRVATQSNVEAKRREIVFERTKKRRNGGMKFGRK